jgi:long-chain fatty acid transport protein
MEDAIQRKSVTLVLFLLALLLSHRALAVGFIVNAPSQITGMTNAGSTVYDRSAVVITSNPAAMALMSGEQIGGNLTGVFPDWEVNEGWDCDAADDCSDNNAQSSTFIPTLGYVRPLNDRFTWGIGFGAMAGQGMEYGKQFRGRPIVYKNEVSVLGLINSISWRMNDNWTFGVGAGGVYGEYTQKQDLPSLSASAGDDIHSIIEFVGLARNCEGLPPPAALLCLRGAVDESGLNPESAAETIASLRSYLEGEPGTNVKLEGDDIEMHIVAGLTWEFMPGHRLGFAYNYTGDFKLEGNANIKGQLLSDLEYQKPDASLTWDMPERIVFSGSHTVTDRLNFYWDFERVFFDDFETTDLDIEGYPLLSIDRNFKDANRYAIGTEYALNNRMILQLGLSLDESPVDDSDRMPDIPVEEIIKTSVGLIYEVNDKLTVQGYGIVEFLGDGEIEQLASINGEKLGESFEMDTDAVVYVVGASFSYKF